MVYFFFFFFFLDSCIAFDCFGVWSFVAFALNSWWANFFAIVVVLGLFSIQPLLLLFFSRLLVFFLFVVYLRAPDAGPQFPEYPTSSVLVTSLVDGLIQAHPPIFYTSLLFFFFLGPWGRFFYSARILYLRFRYVYYFRVVLLFLCSLALLSGGY